MNKNILEILVELLSLLSEPTKLVRPVKYNNNGLVQIHVWIKRVKQHRELGSEINEMSYLKMYPCLLGEIRPIYCT